MHIFIPRSYKVFVKFFLFLEKNCTHLKLSSFSPLQKFYYQLGVFSYLEFGLCQCFFVLTGVFDSGWFYSPLMKCLFADKVAVCFLWLQPVTVQ